jgi:hypothetical protein
MPLHLIKLCVGVDEVGELSEWCARERRTIVRTRQTPKRAAEVLEGGSLYWVIKGLVLVRQQIIGIETLGSEGMTRCEIELARAPVLTAPQPRRAFQGWRYLALKDAPPDLPTGEGEEIPGELAAQLRQLGAW